MKTLVHLVMELWRGLEEATRKGAAQCLARGWWVRRNMPKGRPFTQFHPHGSLAKEEIARGGDFLAQHGSARTSKRTQTGMLTAPQFPVSRLCPPAAQQAPGTSAPYFSVSSPS